MNRIEFPSFVSINMTRPAPELARVVPTNRESPLPLADLFFSCTDAKGFITSCNDVFVRVSEYSREQLLGSPHRIIRHPDMPRAVFQLLWDRLHAGKGIAAYVKNMSATGAYYWVLAIVTPIAGGYLSIRLKPSSPFFEQIPKLYATLRAAEAELEASGQSKFKAIERSSRLLQEALGSLGFTDYDTFADTALLHEVCARREVVRREPVRLEGATGKACEVLTTSVASLFGQLELLSRLQVELVENTVSIRQLVAGLRRLSVNAHINAMQLSEAGVTLEVVADHMNRCSQALGESTHSLASSMQEADAALLSARSAIATGDLSVEMMVRFLQEQRSTTSTSNELRESIEQLSEVVMSRLGDACAAAQRVEKQIVALNSQMEAFRKQVRTLEILHVTGKAEAARVEKASHLATILDDVQQSTLGARQRLIRLCDLMASIRFQPCDLAHISQLMGTLS